MVLLPLIRRLRTLFQLKRLEIDGPFPFVKLAGTNTVEGKKVVFMESYCDELHTIKNALEIMRQAREFVGAGFSSFSCSGVFKEDCEVELGKVLQELYLHSRFSLQKLHFSSFLRFDLAPYSLTWPSWFNFPNLTSLAFAADASSTFPLGRPTQMTIPTDSIPLRLNYLNIKSQSLGIDWEALGEMIGDELEHFDFEEDFNRDV